MIGESVWNASLPSRNPVLQKLLALVTIKNSVCVFVRPHVKMLHVCVPASESKCNKPFSHHRKSCAFVSVDLMPIFVFTMSISVLLFCFYIYAQQLWHICCCIFRLTFLFTKSTASFLFPQTDMIYCFNCCNMTFLFLQIQLASVASKR